MLWNILLLLSISLAWASNYLFIGKTDHDFGPLTMSALITGFAAISLLIAVPLLFRRPLLQPLKENYPLLTIMSLMAITLPELAAVIAEKGIDSDTTSLIGIGVPIFTFIITVFITRTNHYSHQRMAGVFVAVIGIIIYISSHKMSASGSQTSSILIMLAGGLIFALNGILVASRIKAIDHYAVAALVVTISAITLSVLAVIFERQQFKLPDTNALWPIVSAGIFSTGLAYLGYFILLGRTGAYFSSLYAYLIPIFGVILAVTFTNEPLTFNHIAGLLIVLLGLWLLIRPKKKPY